MPGFKHACLCTAALASLGLLSSALPTVAVAQQSAIIDLRGEAAPAAAGRPYAAGTLPDRIVLTPSADPATGMAVSWRTDTATTETVAEIAEMAPSPGFGARAQQLQGTSAATLSENGAANYHKVRFANLKPDTAYAYRVKSAAGFSEWHQFRTAAAEERPFRFLYFGDTQNGILEIGSLAWRRALLQAQDPQLILHAGDLVASRDDVVHDDEWGQWTAAGGWALAAIPQVPATGNHEYVDLILPDGTESRRLGNHWPVMFNLAGNGAPEAAATTYALDYQGVRFVVLDGTSALELGTLEAQTKWLEARLSEAQARWKVVLFHQPLFTCARPNDTNALKQAWKPVFERHGVDLVLQGHDHCYSRLTSEAGRDAGVSARASGAVQGPVYMVSVAGSKMYGLNDRSPTQPDRVAEDTSLFQVVDVSPEKLSLRAYLNTGMLYDGFELTKGADGRNTLRELGGELPQVRRCTGPAQEIDGPMPVGRIGPDGLQCTAEVKD